MTIKNMTREDWEAKRAALERDGEIERRWTVWLGYHASIWSHRGYEVSGETVYTDTRRDAERLVRESLPDGAVRVRADDGDYWYATQDAADRDDDGSSADAVVSASDD